MCDDTLHIIHIGSIYFDIFIRHRKPINMQKFTADMGHYIIMRK